MVAKTIRIKNNTDVTVTLAGQRLQPGEYVSVDNRGLPNWLDRPTVTGAVISQNLVVNDGYQDFTDAQEGLDYLVGKAIESINEETGPDVTITPAGRVDAYTINNTITISGTPRRALVGADYITVTSGVDAVTLATDNPSLGTFVTTTVLPEVMPVISGPDTIIYVSKNGSDSSGDGAFHNPYLTVASGLALAADLEGPAHVMVYPGTYIETSNPTVTSGVTLASVGAHAGSTTLVASVSGSAFLTMESNSTLCGLTLSTPVTDYAVFSSDESYITLHSMELAGGQGGLYFSNGFHTILSDLSSIGATYTDVITVSGGHLAASHLVGAHGLNCDNFFKFTGVSRGNLNRVTVGSKGATNAILVEEDSNVSLRTITTSGVTNSLTILGDATTVGVVGSDFNSSDLDLNILSSTAELNLTGCRLSSRNKVAFPVGFPINTVSFADTTHLDECSVVWGELSVGLPEHGSEAVFGEGDSYVRGMVVLTTDNTATSSGIGGNLTDTSDLASYYGSSFSFQGTTANHTILVGSALEKASGMVKHWGMKMNQFVGAVENTPKSFAVEIWDGTTWSGVETMATERNEYYRYSNSLFLRGPSYEQVRYGVTEDTQWETTTISGQNLYWARLRITDDLVTAPVFERFALHSSRLEINPDGTQTFHGRARFRQTLMATGNIFGESGGVTGGWAPVGSGTLPTGWNHYAKNNVLNGTGDAIYSQFIIPKGTDTSLPFYITLTYQTRTDNEADITFAVSFLPLEVENVLIADPAGGILPVPRDEATLSTTTARPGQVYYFSKTMTDICYTKIHSFTTCCFDVSDFYEGDMVVVRIGLTENTPPQDSMFIWAIELSGVKWTTGVRQ